MGTGRNYLCRPHVHRSTTTIEVCYSLNTFIFAMDNLRLDLYTCVLAGPLTKVINQSIKTSKFPTKWKASKVCPVYKKGDIQALKNYRPVSLLSVPGMVCERVIAIQAEQHFEDNKILQEFQFGFRRFKSTISDADSL